MVDHSNLVVEDATIGLIKKDPFLDKSFCHPRERECRSNRMCADSWGREFQLRARHNGRRRLHQSTRLSNRTTRQQSRLGQIRGLARQMAMGQVSRASLYNFIGYLKRSF